MRLCRFSTLGLLALAIAGCDDRPPTGSIPVHPVNGQLVYKGKPLADALVTFHPASASEPGPIKPTGRTDADGNFRLHSYVGDDGAPAGDYRVSVSVANTSESRNVMIKATRNANLVSLPPKFADPASSGLTATVRTGENALGTLELK
jgi:hypothetical protein